MSPQLKARRGPSPLEEASLKEMALRYVGKYATTRARLCSYLARKLRERGWQGKDVPDLEALADRFADLGLIDDSAYALGKARALAARGYGRQRLAEHLRHAGVTAEHSRDAFESAKADEMNAALHFAKRRKIGPFAGEAADRRTRERNIAAMVRAGHDLDIARTIARMGPTSADDLLNLCESYRSDAA